jgi:hypothetical protein
VSLGVTPGQQDLFRSTAGFCDTRVAPDSIYSVLHRECFRLFPDGMFADLFTDSGRRSVPPQVVAVVMVLQRLEGCSDREAADRFAFDLRWKYAAGGLDYDYPGFVHTVLVDMRARLARSAHPDRVFDKTLEVARAAGLVGRRRVLDSTPIYDAVATMDTVTLVRSALRGLLAAAGRADGALEARLRGLLRRDDDYTTPGKPACDWADAAARTQLVDALATDATAVLGALDGAALAPALAEAAALLATVVGQDLDTGAGGVFRIARKVAKNRVISTVDPEARHGHKTAARGFDGYKGHVAEDPDSEIITATAVTPGNSGDAEAAEALLADVLPPRQPTTAPTPADPGEPDPANAADTPAGPGEAGPAPDAERTPAAGSEPGPAEPGPAVYGDAAYGAGPLLARLEDADADIKTKVQPPTAPAGHFPKDAFTRDPEAGTATCPAGVTVPIRPTKDGGGMAAFGAACATCPLAAACTSAKSGRTVTYGPHEDQLARARATQADPAWVADYRATRPKVERKIGHLMRRKHGGRRARVRGRAKVAADFTLLAAAANLARMAALGLAHTAAGWAAAG